MHPAIIHILEYPQDGEAHKLEPILEKFQQKQKWV
jgi:hypothetical protein